MPREMYWVGSQTDYRGPRRYCRRSCPNVSGKKKFPVTKRRKFGAYSLFGLEFGASVKSIRAAYKRLCLAFHPDKHAGASPQKMASVEKKMKEINAAYRMLIDEDGRDEYDEETFGASTSTLRVRAHRRRLTPPSRQVVSAMSVWREKTSRNRLKNVAGDLVAVKFPNINNKHVKTCYSQLLVIKRRTEERSKDHRKGPFVVVEKKRYFFFPGASRLCSSFLSSALRASNFAPSFFFLSLSLFSASRLISFSSSYHGHLV